MSVMLKTGSGNLDICAKVPKLGTENALELVVCTL